MKLLTKRLIVILGAGAVLAGFTLLLLGARNSHLPSSFDDETIEVKQNKIPEDVLSWAREQNQVLGIQYPSNRPLHILPKFVRVPILMYHYVEYVKDKGDTIRQSLDITPYTLEQEIITLKNAGYTFLTNSELTQILDGAKRLPNKPILLTFDDGYRDFYTDAYPILKKYNVQATEYLIAGWTGYPNNMTEAQIKEIAADGLVEIGAHTVHHTWLKGLPLKTVQYEVVESKKILEAMIGKPVTSFAYPYGAFDLAAVNAVAQAGFTSAVTTVPGIDQPQIHRYFLYRLRPGGRTGESLLSWLESVKDEQISFLPGGTN
jgi:peptidoglycan/xylan/chitin deacetylase (PgdA/CDA1 family)